MAQKIILLLIIVSVFFSCEEEENPNKIPDDLPRFNELKANYKSILTSSDQGWIVSYQPSENTGEFQILMKFRDDGTVTIMSDMNTFATTNENVFFDIKGATYPELVFETFCVWHQLYEVADGEFQFRIISIDENVIELGNIYSDDNPDVTFTKATQEDYQQMTRIQEIDQLVYDFYNQGDEYFKVMQFDESNVKGLIDFDFNRHQVYITSFDATGIANSSLVNYRYDENGVIFSNDLIIAGETISRFNISQTVDTALNLTGSPLNNGVIYAADMPDFEFTGAINQFNQYTFYVVVEYSPSLDTLEQQIQEAGAYVFAQIYRDIYISQTQRYNALTFLIYEEINDYDFYSFYINQFTRFGEDRLRFHWSGDRGANVTNELVEILRNYLLFFFDQNGFKIVPMNDVFIFVSFANPKNYLVVLPVS